MQRRRLGSVLIVCSLAVLLTAACASKANDAQLATNLKAEMFSDPQTKDTNLQVAVKDGIVTLSGDVPSDAARLEAYKIATNTPGVRKVNDQMTVQALQPVAQAASPQATSEAATVPEPAPSKNAGLARERRAEHERLLRARDARLRKQREERTHRAPAEAKPAPSVPAESTTAAPTNPPAEPPAPQTQSTEASAPAPAPQPVIARFPAGTTVEVQTIDSIDAKTSQPGDEFQASLAQPLTWDGRVVVPAGANVYLRLAAVQTSGHYRGKSELQLQLARLEFQGQQYEIDSSTYTVAGGSRGKNTAEKVGGGAVLGAIIGAIAGGGKGAAIGAGVGAAGGGVYQGVTKAKQVRIPSETRLDFKLEKSLEISLASDSGAQ